MSCARQRPLGKILILFALLLSFSIFVQAQTTFPVNGIANPREGCYVFAHATLVKDGQTSLSNATLVIRDGLIVSAGADVAAPKDAVVIDCTGKYIYPSFIDLYSDYGMPVPERERGGAARPAFDFRAPPQFESNTKGAYNWNQAIHPETDASRLFAAD